jgi:hypothetical protein
MSTPFTSPQILTHTAYSPHIFDLWRPDSLVAHAKSTWIVLRSQECLKQFFEFSKHLKAFVNNPQHVIRVTHVTFHNLEWVKRVECHKIYSGFPSSLKYIESRFKSTVEEVGLELHKWYVAIISEFTRRWLFTWIPLSANIGFNAFHQLMDRQCNLDYGKSFRTTYA